MTRKFECDICNYRYIDKSTLRKHKNVHTEKIEENQQCPECDSTPSSQREMSRHMPRSGHLPYQCKECHLKFWSKDRLDKHSEFHNPNRRFQCDTCKLRYLDKDALTRHIRGHEKKKQNENINT